MKLALTLLTFVGCACHKVDGPQIRQGIYFPSPEHGVQEIAFPLNPLADMWWRKGSGVIVELGFNGKRECLQSLQDSWGNKFKCLSSNSDSDFTVQEYYTPQLRHNQSLARGYSLSFPEHPIMVSMYETRGIK